MLRLVLLISLCSLEVVHSQEFTESTKAHVTPTEAFIVLASNASTQTAFSSENIESQFSTELMPSSQLTVSVSGSTVPMTATENISPSMSATAAGTSSTALESSSISLESSSTIPVSSDISPVVSSEIVLSSTAPSSSSFIESSSIQSSISQSSTSSLDISSYTVVSPTAIQPSSMSSEPMMSSSVTQTTTQKPDVVYECGEECQSLKRRLYISAAFAVIFVVVALVLGVLLYRQYQISRDYRDDPALSRLI